MQQNIYNKTISLPDGRTIEIETGKLARQADGAVVVKMGKTMLLATVVSSKDAKEGIDFLPLSVDYQEKFGSTGKIPGGFLKREARLSEYEILISRLVDRAIRPLFPDDYHSETQINIWLISGDADNLPDSLAALAASAALTITDIPFDGPISEVRVARVEGEYIINPSAEKKALADLDLIVAGTMKDIMMVEGEMKEVTEADMLEAMKIAHAAIKDQCQAQKDLEAEMGKTVKREYSHEENDEELYKSLHDKLYNKVYEVAKKQIADKKLRSESFDNVFKEHFDSFTDEEKDALNMDMVSRYVKKIKKEACRDLALKDKKRLDGRDFEEIRPIWSEVDYLPGTHGSAIFTRGETQSLSTVTLGTKLDEQLIDGAMFSGTSKFFLHYNFPGFSTGEVRPNRGPGRREIGHGNLAYRALKNVIPQDSENPYTIRIVSDILESNGSSSMATVCAGCLALMDSG
ncbi:MAG: polyribonucleotide nucleotidyltransferase, partial [Cyclobacteriaceae bacterium]|nr:polyribonucleotide nucleotidyltransferase [Cyclobacteriaceae bacterium]